MIDTYITLRFPHTQSDRMSERVAERVKADSIIPPPSHDDHSSCTLCDSSSDPNDPVLLQKLRSSDVVFLLHDASRPSTLESIRDTWLPLVHSAFGTNHTKSAVIIRSKNDLFTGVCDYRLSEEKSTCGVATSGVLIDSVDDSDSEDVAVSQDGTGPLFSNTSNTEATTVSDDKTNDMTFSYMGVDITQPDKFSVAELEIGKSYPFISALSICSAATRIDQVVDLIVSAEEMFRCPLAPLYTKELGYTSQCLIALQRIFRHHDQDHDGVLSDEEFKKLQHCSLGINISDDELAQMKALIEDINEDFLQPIWTNLFPSASFSSSSTATSSSASSASSFTSYTGQPLHLSTTADSKPPLVCSSTGITFSGFRKILEMHICRDRQGVVWDILRAHGYGVDMRTPSVSKLVQGFSHVNNSSDDEDDEEEDDDDTDDEEVNSDNGAADDGQGLGHSIGVKIPKNISEKDMTVPTYHHPGCVCVPHITHSQVNQSENWVDLTSPSSPNVQTEEVVTLLSPDALDFLHGLFSQKQGSRPDFGLKIAPEVMWKLLWC
jgi:hypothetical protein